MAKGISTFHLAANQLFVPRVVVFRFDLIEITQTGISFQAKVAAFPIVSLQEQCDAFVTPLCRYSYLLSA